MRVRHAPSETLLNPERPGLTAVFCCGCAFWAASAAIYAACLHLDAQTCIDIALVSGTACLALAALCLVTRKPTVGMAVASLLLGACIGGGGAAHVHTWGTQAEQLDWTQAEVVLLSDSREGSQGERALARVTATTGESAVFSCDFPDSAPLMNGESVKGRAVFRPPD